MIVIADTSPICYLLLIEQINLLPQLYGQVIISTVVQAELTDPSSPAVVRQWINQPPTWLRVIESPVAEVAGLAHLDAGERSAISLTEALKADLLLIDELLGRRTAKQRGIRITGLLGILQAAGKQQWIDLPIVIQKLRQTSFRASESLFQQILNDLE
jgi:predicted nucleic acid-binding protein